MQIGDRVRVKQEQPGRIGKPEYPWRVGTIVRENQFGRCEGGLWYVQLDPTSRAKGREIVVYGKHLDVLPLPGDHYWRKLAWEMRNRTGLLIEEQVIERSKTAYLRWQLYPEHYGGPSMPKVQRHHEIGDEPMDDWFLSRIYDEIHHGPKCGGEA